MKVCVFRISTAVRVFVTIITLMVPAEAFSVISLGLSGTAETTNSGAVSRKEHALSFRTGISLGDHFQVGMAHRRSFNKEVSSTKEYIIESDTTTNSADLTFIPFTGHVSPYIFGGKSMKTVKGKFVTAETVETFKQPATYPVIYGFGLQVFLNANFSLRVSQTYSPSTKTVVVEGVEEEKPSLDSYTEVGINYKLQ
jgi:hypothetical protein